MPKVLGFLTDWRNGLAVLIAAAIVVWLMQDGSLPLGSVVIIFLVSLAAVYVVTGLWSLITKSRKAPPA